MHKIHTFYKHVLHSLRVHYRFFQNASLMSKVGYGYPSGKTFAATLPYSLQYLAFIGLGKMNPDEKTGDWNLQKDINKCLSSAEKAIKAGDLEKAKKILNRALASHEDSKTIGVTCVYDMLATVAFQEGNIERSKEMLEKVIHYLTTSGLPSDHNQVVSFRLKLARILSKLGKMNEADSNFRKCLEIQKLKYQVGVKDEEAEKLWINCLYWYGKHLTTNNKLNEAKHCFESAYNLTARSSSFENRQVLVILYNLGETMMSMGDVNGAFQHFLNAVIIGQMANSPDLPHYYTKLGLLYLRKGMLQEARHWCETGRSGAKRHGNKSAQNEGENCINEINEALKLGPLKI